MILENVKTIFALLAPFLLAGVVYLYNRKGNLEKQIASEKRRIYRDFVEFFAKFLGLHKERKGKFIQQDISEISKSMMKFAVNFLLFASPKVIHSLNTFRLFAFRHKEQNDPTLLLKWADLILDMREDLGLSNRTMPQATVLQTFIAEDVKIALKDLL